MINFGAAPNSNDAKPAEIKETDPRLIQYVQDARHAGLHDEIIWDELKRVGWPDEIIKKVLRS